MKLNEQELQEFLALVNLVSVEKFKALQIQNNTALIPRGQEIAKEQEAISRLLENVKDNWVASKLTELGVEKGKRVSINPKSGEIIEIKSDESANNPKT